MGIFNFLRKRKTGIDAETASSNLQNEEQQTTGSTFVQPHNQTKNNTYSPIVTEIEAKDHDEEFAALLGYPTMQNELSELMINHVIQDSLERKPIYENPIFKVCEADFLITGGDADTAKIRTIYILLSAAGKNFVYEAFAYLQTNRVLPFETKEIVHWKKGTNFQAEIIGAGRDKFKVGFFATDFAINRSLYYGSASLNIRLSALAFVIDESNLTEINGTPVAEDFSSYMPNKDFNSNSHYDFIGKLLDFREIQLGNELSGYIMAVKLINMPEDEDFFTIDIFVNKLNMRIKELSKGMKITGAIWLQGEISK